MTPDPRTADRLFDTRAIPAGAHWYCGTGPLGNRCYRDLAVCEDVARTRHDPRTSRCVERPRVFCFTSHTRQRSAGCGETLADCNGVRAKAFENNEAVGHDIDAYEDDISECHGVGPDGLEPDAPVAPR